MRTNMIWTDIFSLHYLFCASTIYCLCHYRDSMTCKYFINTSSSVLPSLSSFCCRNNNTLVLV